MARAPSGSGTCQCAQNRGWEAARTPSPSPAKEHKADPSLVLAGTLSNRNRKWPGPDYSCFPGRAGYLLLPLLPPSLSEGAPLPASYRHPDNTSWLVLAAATDKAQGTGPGILCLHGSFTLHTSFFNPGSATAIHPTAQDRCHHHLRGVLLRSFVLRQTIRKSHFHSPSTLSLCCFHPPSAGALAKTQNCTQDKTPNPREAPTRTHLCHSPSVTALRPTRLRLSSD